MVLGRPFYYRVVIVTHLGEGGTVGVSVKASTFAPEEGPLLEVAPKLWMVQVKPIKYTLRIAGGFFLYSTIVREPAAQVSNRLKSV